MASLRIRQVIYSGQEYEYKSPLLDNNIVLIEGDNGTGKSTLCNLIYFGLGGRVKEFRQDSDKKHKEITSDVDNYVELYISIDNQSYLLRRFFSGNDITIAPFVEKEIKTQSGSQIVFDVQERAQDTVILPVYRREDEPYTVSDWVLEKLGIAVVELYQGYKNFKINFTDLMRLIYHDQQPDPEFIYKKLDGKSNFVTDSETLRKAIFELLVGDAFSEFYEAIVAVKKAEQEKALAKSLVDEYTSLADKLRGKEELRNTTFLQEEIREKESQLDKLHAARNAFKSNRESSSTLDPNIERLKDSVLKSELALSEIGERLVGLFDERYRLVSVRDDTVDEIGQIQKIIHTHKQLNLFSSDTCPYCLANVDRAEGHCVCGATIEEEQYERFFYSAKEYNDLLKTKTKSLSTIELALTGCNDEVSHLEASRRELEKKAYSEKEKLRALLEKLDQPIDLESINELDDKILDTRQEIAHLVLAVETESKLETLQKDYDRKRERVTEYELSRRELEVAAKKEIAVKVKKFSKIYNKYMVGTLSDCRSAHIRLEDYMPSVNDGEYREASSKVPIRLMYYLSLMELSLVEPDVPFPRFLLVDTPETAGIELENLVNVLGKFKELESTNVDFQVILATGLRKYPESMLGNRVLYMPTKAEALLKRRPITEPDNPTVADAG